MTGATQLVAIGASAGGLDALRTLLGPIPGTFPAAICIVVHTAPESPGVLGQILDRSAQLPVSLATDGQRLEAGHVYVAPPDRHLLIEPGRIRVTKGPREHRFRPAIDPLFRSAAQVFGPAAIGIVLTGNLDDGTAGLWTVKQLGGTAIVQDPREALFPSMPLSAVRHVRVDHVVPLVRMSSLLVELIMAPAQLRQPTPLPEHISMEINIAKEHNPRDAGLERLTTPSPYACPECHGVLLEIAEGGRVRFRCHTGHAYSLDSLLAAMHDGIEDAMHAAIRALVESSLLMQRMAHQLKQHGHAEAAARMQSESENVTRRSEAIRSLLGEPNAVSAAGD